MLIREARLIIPQKDNNGQRYPHIIKQLEDQLVKAFGGFTKTKGVGVGGVRTGGILSTIKEPIYIYDIAIKSDRTGTNTLRLHQIARWVCVEANQLEVYLRDACGYVEFVKAS